MSIFSKKTKKIISAVFAGLFLLLISFSVSHAQTDDLEQKNYYVDPGKISPPRDSNVPIQNYKPPVENPTDFHVVPPEKPKDTKTTYNLLAPLPGLEGTIETAPSDANPCPFGKYLNLVISLFLGICAIMAMVMIVMGGIEYMTSELGSSKEAGKSKATNAVLGLLIALSAYLVLNTINPNLLNICLKVPGVTIENFELSGGQTFDGKPIKVNFNTEAYPGAKTASEKTGVDTAFILSIFAQETSSGSSHTGSCNYLTANMDKPGKTDQLEALKKIAKDLNIDYTKINMSCSGGGSTRGGAIGYTQFIPTTWLQYRDEAKKYLGHEPNPWNVEDALMMTAIKLKADGGVSNEEQAACKYFGSCNVIINCGGGKTGTYGQCALAKKLSIQDQIEKAKKKGKI